VAATSSQLLVLDLDRSDRWVIRRMDIGEMWSNGPAIAGLSILGLMLILAITAPAIAPYDPAQQDTTRLLEGPSATHLFGTDDLGRDTLSRVIHGSQPALTVSFIATGFALTVGTALGLIAGYMRGLLDSVLMRVMDGLLAVPMLVVALTITGVAGPSLSTVIVAIGVANVPVFARLARGQTLAVRSLDYVVAARGLGARPIRVVLQHVLPNILTPILVQISLTMATALLTEAGLSFLGLGVQPPAASWGSMLVSARGFLLRDPWFAIAPGIAICSTVLAFSLLGDALRDALDPRLRSL
jgi:peptide/nickel transport system permease protein